MTEQFRGICNAACAVLLLASCNSSPTGGSDGGATLKIRSINDVSVAAVDTVRATDSLAVAVTVANPEGALAINTLHLVATTDRGVLPDTTFMLAALNIHIPAGQQIDTVLRAFSAPSGTYALTVTTDVSNTATSAAIPVELQHPTTWVRLLSINGRAVDTLSVNTVQDSFRAAIAFAVGDSHTRIGKISLYGRADASSAVFWLGALNDTVLGGISRKDTFTAYIAPPGDYEVLPEVGTNSDPVRGRAIAVAVSQSDTTPPAFTDIMPADGAVVTALPLNLSFSATDSSGIWQIGYMVIGDCGVSYLSGNAGPNDAVYIFNQQICGLNVGENRIVLQAQDVAWNAAYDTITVTYQPN